jgi:hypothetical protein
MRVFEDLVPVDRSGQRRVPGVMINFPGLV